MVSESMKKGFSIIIPSWNNLIYLHACIQSIKKYSTLPHEIVVHVNEGTDGSQIYCQREKIKHTVSRENLGVCKAVNQARTKCTREVIMFFNDDMIALPKWDTELVKFAEEHKLDERVWLSGTMIEPTGHNDCCIAPRDYGKVATTFREQDLLDDLEDYRDLKGNVNGSTWPPNMLHASIWDEVGGLSEEFFPGQGHDPDLAKKLWDVGVRDFIGVGRSLVYHFVSKTVRKAPRADGRKIFLDKHGISIDDFVRNVMKRGTVWEGPNEKV